MVAFLPRILISVFLLPASSFPLSSPVKTSLNHYVSKPSSDNNNRSGRQCITAALQVTLHIQGRKINDHNEVAFEQYAMRLTPHRIQLKTVWHKSNDQLTKAIKATSREPCICLDVCGQQLDSGGFEQLLYQRLVEGGSRLAFVIGGAEGLPDEVREKKDPKLQHVEFISLSSMTFTHQMARVILAEQVYRAAEIRKGTGYHK
uniref:Ribosomal RNA large subunit methyltransferase H n=1 Tax=Octactis speculum TaxID=3111310 RepID=A0A7S2F628_9STRA|mmetsp:Transcript_15364/g.20636  ORF Transcript_15364/g.20636 Transcript_15364/m.20636 type:complete len:203 (+) Transcript_15364:10-618(+)